MIPLLADAIEAHGGLSRWNAHDHLAATIVTGGDFWALKGVEENLTPRIARIDLQHNKVSLTPFGKTGQRTDFSPDRIAIVTEDDRVIAERKKPTGLV